jgi:hypothetical protein
MKSCLVLLKSEIAHLRRDGNDFATPYYGSTPSYDRLNNNINPTEKTLGNVLKGFDLNVSYE